MKLQWEYYLDASINEITLTGIARATLTATGLTPNGNKLTYTIRQIGSGPTVSLICTHQCGCNLWCKDVFTAGSTAQKHYDDMGKIQTGYSTWRPKRKSLSKEQLEDLYSDLLLIDPYGGVNWKWVRLLNEILCHWED